MEAINDSTKLIAQSIELLGTLSVEKMENEECASKVIDLLKTALDKLVQEIK